MRDPTSRARQKGDLRDTMKMGGWNYFSVWNS